MIKRTLYFGQAARLNTRNDQLVVVLLATGEEHVLPIEDLAIVELDHPQISITQACLARMLEFGVVVHITDERHHPAGLLLPQEGHTLQGKHHRAQAESGKMLLGRLWQLLIQAKIENQARVLSAIGLSAEPLPHLVTQVQTNDRTNREAQAARIYWQCLFGELEFKRERYGNYPNNLLNYSYAILRAIVARAVTSSGLIVGLGIHHRNQYNAFALADDLMEPYRPVADALVWDVMQEHPEITELTRAAKAELLQLPTLDVGLGSYRRPLGIAVQYTTASVARAFVTGECTLNLPQACPTSDLPEAPEDENPEPQELFA